MAMFLIDALIRMFTPLAGLRSQILVECVPESNEEFARIIRQSENIALDGIMLGLSRKGNEWILPQLDALGIDAEDVFGENGLAQADESRIVEVATLCAMIRCVQRVDRVTNDIVWCGDPSRSSNGYRECLGIFQQCAQDATVTEYSDGVSVSELIALSEEKAKGTTVKWNYFILAQPSSNVCDLYILPLSTELEDGGIYEQRVVYHSQTRPPEDIYFWTDNGEFLWTLEKQKWDVYLTCQTGFRIVVPRPELVTVIKNVPIAYDPLLLNDLPQSAFEKGE